MVRFEKNRRYRLEVRPAGARTKTVTREWNFLETLDTGEHLFDGRPEMGTQRVPDDLIVGHEDIGPAIWARS